MIQISFTPYAEPITLDEDYIEEYCAQIDRSIEQIDHNRASHQAEMMAIRESYEYEINTEYDPLAYVNDYQSQN